MTLRVIPLAALSLALIAAPAAAQDGGGRMGSRWERMKRFDKDGDGKVSKDEWSGPKAFFARMDADGDGFVDEKEVNGASMGGGRGSMGGPGGRRGGMSGRGGTPDMGWVFKRMDRDGDGKFTEKDLEKIRATADKNGDGKLDEKEFMEFLNAKAKRPPRGEAPKEQGMAPGFELERLDGKGKLALASLLKNERPVVVVFGSLT